MTNEMARIIGKRSAAEQRASIGTVSQGRSFHRAIAGLFVTWIVLLASIAVAQGQWEFFHPEFVTGLSCRIELLDSNQYASTVHRDVWIAEAHAARSDKQLGNWDMTIGNYPPTLKGKAPPQLGGGNL